MGSKAEQETMRFSLGGALGTGASSCVWAVDVERSAAGARRKNKAVTLDGLRRRFAAKFFRPDRLPGPSALENEVKILATLPPSPYIGGFHGQFSVQLRDCCPLEELASKLQPKKVGAQQIAEEREVHEECHFILIDRCDCTLNSLIQNIAFSEAQSAFAFNGLLHGLIHLHSLKIVHRDIKDLNIMVADAGRGICLCDFDLATCIPDDEDVIEWKGGTCGYMAPEVCNYGASDGYVDDNGVLGAYPWAWYKLHSSLVNNNNYGKAGFKADLFSAGVVLHVLLTRSNPFLPLPGVKVQGGAPMDYDMIRLFRSEASCELLDSLLEVDADMRPSARESLRDFVWMNGMELVPKPLRSLVANLHRPEGAVDDLPRTKRRNSFFPKGSRSMLKAPEAGLKKESLKSPPNSSTGMLDLARGALRSFFRTKSRVVPEIVEFDEVCMP